MNFVAPAFLLGLATLALPWLLHRFSQQVPEQRPFPTARFLEAVPPPVSQRQRLRHRMLFALRWLAIIALCLLFARPWLALQGADGEPRTLHLVVLDRSYSMQAGDRFDDAVAALERQLAEVPAGDPVRAFSFDDALTALGEESVGPAEAQRQVQGVTAGHGRGDYGVLMRGLDAVAARAELPVAAIVATDVQASALPLRSNDLFAPALASLTIFESGRATPPSINVRVDAEALTSDDTTVAVKVRLQADHGVPGQDPLAGTISVEHEGDVLLREPVEPLAGTSIERSLPPLTLPAVQSPEFIVRYVSGDGIADALPSDDLQRTAVRRSRNTDVALVSLDRPIDEAARVFVTTALRTGGGADVRNVADGIPADVDMALVFSEHDTGESIAAVIDAVRAGVDVLLLPIASREIGDSPLVEPPDAAVTGVDRAHPLALGDIDWASVRRYGPARWSAQDGDDVLVRSDDGGALLYERPISGAGRLLLLSDPLDGDASNLPYEPAFVELISSLKRWFASSGALPSRIQVGETIALPANVQVFDADGQARLSLNERSAPERVEFDVPGLYRIVDARGERTLSVVTDERESALDPMSSAVLSSWQARHRGEAITIDVDTLQDLPNRNVARDTGRAERWTLAWLLPLLGALLLAESLLANRRLAVRRDGS